MGQSDEENFLIFNPDTIWSKDYTYEINHMIDFYFNQKLKNLLLLVDKDLSFDKNLKGDFGLINNSINLDYKNYIYTGCQILNKSIFKNEKITNFSITKIWLSLIKKNELNGFESQNKFYHVTNLEIFKKLKDL
jgi:MurNAc alpha-1-phosphate uridylyltransferase